MYRLEQAQNSPRYRSVDIMTIAGTFTSETELQRHVESCEAESIKAKPTIEPKGK
jgi:hypothetical protein